MQSLQLLHKWVGEGNLLDAFGGGPPVHLMASDFFGSYFITHTMKLFSIEISESVRFS